MARAWNEEYKTKVEKAWAAWFRAKRTQEGMSQAKVARILEVGQNTVTRWEGGGGLPTYELIIAIRDRLGWEYPAGKVVDAINAMRVYRKALKRNSLGKAA